MIKLKHIRLIVATTVLSAIIFAQPIVNTRSLIPTKPLTFGLRLSTFGLGVEADYEFSEKIHLRAGISYFKYNYPINKVRDDLDGTIKVSPMGIPAILDYWINRHLFLSAGATLNLSKVSLSGTPSESVWIGDIEILPNEVGEINAELTPGNFLSPYVGAGVGFSNVNTSKYSITLDVGILFHDKPKVNLKATGMLTPTASDAQEQLIEDNISQLTTYPIISIIIFYDFL